MRDKKIKENGMQEGSTTFSIFSIYSRCTQNFMKAFSSGCKVKGAALGGGEEMPSGHVWWI